MSNPADPPYLYQGTNTTAGSGDAPAAISSQPPAVSSSSSSSVAQQPPQQQSQPTTLNRQSSSGRPNHVTIFQTTGPNAYLSPIMSPDGVEPALNPRSCVTCRQRKVRCDKQMPCSNCRRGHVACAFPAPGRAPRQSRPKDPNAPPKNTSQREIELIRRLRKLEDFVEELSGQIEVDPDEENPRTAATAAATAQPLGSQGSGGKISESSAADATKRANPAQFSGRLFKHDPKSSGRYVTSGFWTRLNQELDAIRNETEHLSNEDTELSEDELSMTDSPITGSGIAASTPVANHHAFLLGYGSTDVDLRQCHPLGTQSAYLWSVYLESVEPLVKLVHVPTMEPIFQDLRRNIVTLTPAMEALVFAIYYSAITSLNDQDAEQHLCSPKAQLANKYRFGVEQALAKANFLNSAEILVLQAMTLFLFVVRPHDDGRYCWSLVGLLVRLAQGMGLHRDGSNFNLPALDIEIRRRVWWGIITLDLRSAQQLGSDLAIKDRSFDTKKPLNINDIDIKPSDTKPPPQREGLSDLTVICLRCELFAMRRVMVSASISDSLSKNKDPRAIVAQREAMFKEGCRRVEEKYLRHLKEHAIQIDRVDDYVATSMIARTIMAKNFLVVYQPMLDSNSSRETVEEIRKLIYDISFEVVDYQFQLGFNPRYKNSRWIALTYTNWDSITYILMESTRQPWSALMERGWEMVNEYSQNPVETAKTTDSIAINLPLRKLFLRAQKHRAAEIKRLRANPEEVKKLDIWKPQYSTTIAGFTELPGDEERALEGRERWLALMRPDAPSPISGVSENSSATSPPELRTSASPGAPHSAGRQSTSIDQAQSMSSQSSTQGGSGVDLSEATLFYMNNLMRSGGGISFPELWALPQGAENLTMSQFQTTQAPMTRQQQQQAMMPGQFSESPLNATYWPGLYGSIDDNMQDVQGMMSENLDWSLPSEWQADGINEPSLNKEQREWGPTPGM